MYVFRKIYLLNIGDLCFRLINIKLGYKSLHKSVTFGKRVASLSDISIADARGVEFIREILILRGDPRDSSKLYFYVTNFYHQPRVPRFVVRRVFQT